MVKLKTISLIPQKSKNIRKFYEDLLNIKPVVENSDYVEYKTNNLRWGLDPKEVIEQNPEIIVGHRQLLLQLETSDIIEDFQKSKQSMKILTKIKKASWGDTYFFAEDPENNLLYIYQTYENHRGNF